MANEFKNQTLMSEVKDRTRIFLQPVAGASILGLFGYAVALFVIGAQFAHWFVAPAATSAGAPIVFVGAFALMLGGVAQFAAAMWAYKNRDGLSTGFNGIWGAFLLGLGLMNLLVETGSISGVTEISAIPSIGMWFIMLAFISGACAIAALATNFALFGTITVATASSALMGIGYLAGSADTMAVAGYLFMVSAVFAWYTGSAVMIEDSYGYSVLPVGEFRTSKQAEEISSGIGEPGVLHGQWRAYKKRGSRYVEQTTIEESPSGGTI